LVIVLPTNCVSPHGKHFIPLSLSTCLNSFLAIFHPDSCVLPVHISLPDHPVLLATFPFGPFCVCTFYLNSLPSHIRSIDTLSTFKRHLKFHLFQSAFTVQSSCASASDSFSRFLALNKFVCMYVCMYVCMRKVDSQSETTGPLFVN